MGGWRDGVSITISACETLSKTKRERPSVSVFSQCAFIYIYMCVCVFVCVQVFQCAVIATCFILSPGFIT